jgi:hypothetical protein
MYYCSRHECESDEVMEILNKYGEGYKSNYELQLEIELEEKLLEKEKPKEVVENGTNSELQ